MTLKDKNDLLATSAIMPARIPPDQYTQIGQINTRFWAAGDGGKTLVLIHGLGGYVEDWMHNIHALAEQHRVYAMDLVGSGRSDKPSAAYSLPYLAQFVHDFVEAQNIERASLIGHSLGGGVALQFAIRFPAKVGKLVLVSSAGLGREVKLLLRLSTLPIIGEWFTRPTRKGIAEFLKKSMYDPALVTDELVELCYHLAAVPGAQRAMLATARAVINLRGMRDDAVRPIVDHLPHITAPTLIVWGQRDRTLPVAHAYVAEKRMPNARLHIFDPCGHFPQMERPEEFNALVLEFLAHTAT